MVLRHIYFDTKKQALCCEKCGREEPCPTPMDDKKLLKKIRGFELLHQDC